MENNLNKKSKELLKEEILAYYKDKKHLPVKEQKEIEDAINKLEIDLNEIIHKFKSTYQQYCILDNINLFIENKTPLKVNFLFVGLGIKEIRESTGLSDIPFIGWESSRK